MFMEFPVEGNGLSDGTRVRVRIRVFRIWYEEFSLFCSAGFFLDTEYNFCLRLALRFERFC